MTDYKFVADDPPGGLGYKAASFEQAYLEDRLAGYAVEQTVGVYQSQILDLLDKHGATEIAMTRGSVVGRAAFRLRFLWCGIPVEIVQVALPSHVDSKRSNDQAARQALYHMLNEIRFELERRQFHPELPAFIPYMQFKTDQGPMAVWKMISAAQQFALPVPKLDDDVIEAVFVEVKSPR